MNMLLNILRYIKRFIRRTLTAAEHAFSIAFAVVTGKRKKGLRYLESIKDIHKGERCFVIGNGPSLKPEDLDKLRGEVTFASNKIYNIFDKTDWRPTYFTIFDEGVGKSKGTIEGINSFQCEMKFAREEGYYIFGRIKEPVCFIHSQSSRKYLDNPDFSEDLTKVTYSIATVTYISLQLARHMGISEIYLLGMDNQYAYSQLRDGTIIKNEGCANYFGEESKPSDENEKMPRSAPATWEMDVAYAFAEKYSREHGFRIYNATRGGKLEAFERVDFDSLFGSA